ncbi:MAG: 2-oxo acid dehydrogenase subunit E2 [Planctomycetota bacterium]|jgi:pyruvate dehydrogenase E2 component (dihydrolipoamide acetyltransferase)|nr:2-oxo acid dehydrogenase subunit E2 [Planctomycetota bacterium]
MIRQVLFSPPGDRLSFPRAGLVEWLAPLGNWIEAGDPLCLYEIDKAIASFPSPVSGFVRRILADEGGRFSQGDVLALLADSLDEGLPGTAAPAIASQDSPDVFDWNEIDNREGGPEPLGIMRRTIAQRMAMSKRHIPCFYLTTAVDMTSARARRSGMRQTGGKAATFNDMAIKASALALAKNPRAAAIYSPAGLIRRQDLNIGFAAALPDEGLVVPVVRRADRKSLDEITAETRELAERAKKGELRPEDCAGGVFSVSYLGSYEVESFAAIVNPGEAAIAAMGKTIDTPVALDGQMAIRPIARITLSCDHRSIDGDLAARLAGSIKRFLEHAEEL